MALATRRTVIQTIPATARHLFVLLIKSLAVIIVDTQSDFFAAPVAHFFKIFNPESDVLAGNDTILGKIPSCTR